jgi:hypothetical protein
MALDRLRRLVLELLSRELKRPRNMVLFASLAFGGCIGGISPAAKLDDAVKETNDAARFGRTDLAVERVLPASRAAFAKRHRLWGSEVRVVDVEYGGLEKMSEGEAVIVVGFGWFRPAEGVLRTTMVRQTWRNDRGRGPWYLDTEERVGGDVGLLGEAVTLVKPDKKNAQFETTVIR